MNYNVYYPKLIIEIKSLRKQEESLLTISGQNLNLDELSPVQKYEYI